MLPASTMLPPGTIIPAMKEIKYLFLYVIQVYSNFTSSTKFSTILVVLNLVQCCQYPWYSVSTWVDLISLPKRQEYIIGTNQSNIKNNFKHINSHLNG